MQWHRDLRVRKILPPGVCFLWSGGAGWMHVVELGVVELLRMECLGVGLHTVDVLVVCGLDPFCSMLPN